MKYQRKPATVEAAQVSEDLHLIDGVVVPGGHWLVFHEDGHTSAVDDGTFHGDYEPFTEPEPAVDTPEPEPPVQSTDAPPATPDGVNPGA